MVVYEDTELTPHLHPQWIYQKYNYMLSSSHWKWRGDWHNNFSTTKGREEKLPGGKATHRIGRQYHWLGDLPWGAWSSGYLSGTPALGSSSGQMSHLAGLKTGRACWRAARNQGLCFWSVHARAETCLLPPHPHLPPCSSTVERQQTGNSLVLAALPAHSLACTGPLLQLFLLRHRPPL